MCVGTVAVGWLLPSLHRHPDFAGNWCRWVLPFSRQFWISCFNFMVFVPWVLRMKFVMVRGGGGRGAGLCGGAVRCCVV